MRSYTGRLDFSDYGLPMLERHLRRLIDAMEARYSITPSARASSVWWHVETRCRNTLRNTDGGNRGATDVCLPRAQPAVEREKAGLCRGILT
jgi:hypothetical protein